jgi:TetR/AcrR family transcriptional repressor of lmrAB and yxaGH operons
MIRAYCRLLAGWMAKSGFRDGCPISTTLLESAPQSVALAAAGREAFAGWCAVIARALVRDGFGKLEAKRLSTLAVSAIEGALILARVEGNAAPIDDVAKALAGTLQFRAPVPKRVAS